MPDNMTVPAKTPIAKRTDCTPIFSLKIIMIPKRLTNATLMLKKTE
jgi:hypothetical protein